MNRYSKLGVEAILLLLGGPDHLAQLELLGELAREGAQVLDEIVAGRDDGVLGSDLAVGLHTQEELGDQWMRDLVSSKQHVGVLQQTRAQQVAQRVVLFVERKDGRRGDSCGLLAARRPEQRRKRSRVELTSVNLDLDLVLAGGQHKRLVSRLSPSQHLHQTQAAQANTLRQSTWAACRSRR